jgi:hypothetical protein
MANPGNDEAQGAGEAVEPADGESVAGSVAPADGEAVEETHWVRWHQAYENPDSALTARLLAVQADFRAVLDQHPKGAIRVVSMCAGQGRDVIDVVAVHPRRADVRARLVELDPELVAFARARAVAAGVGDLIEVVEGDASRAGLYAGALPADVVLICGVFGNISDDDIRALIGMMPSLCAPGGTVIWTRHRRPPDLTPSIREWFAEAGFAEQSYVAPAQYILGVGCHRLVGASASGTGTTGGLDPDLRLFDFRGDGSLPA